MTPEQQNIIDNIHRISDWCIRGLILIVLIVMFLKPDNWIWWVLGALLLIAILLNVVSAHWATDEEKEEFKRAVKEAVQEAAEQEHVALPILPAQAVYDPFTDSVTEEQKQAILQLLHDLPSHKEKREEINMSTVSHYLTALIELEFISKSKSANKNELRTWVEKATGKQAPEQYRFNDAFPSTYKQGVKRAKDKIKQVLKI